MATVRAGPGRFDQSWIPPGQTTPSEGIYGTTKLEPWLHEYAYIYSSPRLDFTDEVYHTHLPKVSKIIYSVLSSIKVLMYSLSPLWSQAIDMDQTKDMR